MECPLTKGHFMKKIILVVLTFLSISSCVYAQTIPSATPLKNIYSCNSATTNFPYGFPISAPTDITLWQTDNLGNTTQITSNFTVDTTNAWVVYPTSGSACSTGYTLTLLPQTPQTQTTTYTPRSPFTATAVGASLNKLTIISQQLQEQLNRSLKTPVNTIGNMIPANQPGSVLGWDPAGSGNLTNFTPNTNTYITTSTDTTMGGLSGSNSLIPTQAAVNAYVKKTDYIRPESYGAVGVAGTDDYTAFSNMIAAIPAYSTVLLTKIYQLNSNLAITKNINFVGTGPGTGFYLNLNTSTDGISLGNIESASGNIQYVNWYNFGIYGNTGSCRNALVLTGVMNSYFQLWIKAGTNTSGGSDTTNGFAVWARWCIVNSFIITTDYVIPSPSGYTAVQSAGGLKATNSSNGSQVFNDNYIKVNSSGSPGLVVYIYGGLENTIEGLTGSLINHNAILLKSGTSNSIQNLYNEASSGANGSEIILNGESYSKIGPNVISEPASDYKDVQLIGAQNTLINGLFCSSISIDATSKLTRIQNIFTVGQVDSGIYDSGINTIHVIGETEAGNNPTVGIFSDDNSVVSNGGLERWVSTSSLPSTGWTNYSATITRETSIVNQGISSAKVQTTGTDSSALALNIPSALMASNPYGKVTVTGWVYIPTSGGQNVSAETWWDGGATTEAMATVSTRDAWTKISFNLDVTNKQTASSTIYIRFFTSTSGTFYLDGFSGVPGIAGGSSFFTPNANEFPIYTGTATWAPGGILTLGTTTKTFTVLGAAVGMIATAGPGADITGLVVSASVTAANTVTAVLYNPTGSTITPSSSTWYVQAQDVSK